jgi:hypothetical protein
VTTIHGDLIYERYGLTGAPATGARSVMAECLADLGEFADARAHSEESIRLAEALGTPFGLAQGHVRFGDLCLRQGDLRVAISLLERCRGFLEQGGIGTYVPRTMTLLGIAYILDGRPTDGVRLLERGRALLERARVIHGTTAVPLVEGYVLEGRLDDAAERAQRVLDDSRLHEEPGHEAHVLRLIGEIALRRDPPTLARQNGGSGRRSSWPRD